MQRAKKEKIKVLLVDDHPVVREGVRSSLIVHPTIDVVGEASDGAEAIQKTKELSPDVILMDLSMPHMSGLEALKQLQKSMPTVKVIILTMHDSKEYIQQIVQSGARGYVLKDIYPADLVRAIESVHAGEAFFSPSVNRVLVNEYLHKTEELTHPHGKELSHREREVLRLIAEGLTNKVIANRLFVSIRTIETHRERIMRKLNIHSAAGLTKFAISKGMVNLE